MLGKYRYTYVFYEKMLALMPLEFLLSSSAAKNVKSMLPFQT